MQPHPFFYKVVKRLHLLRGIQTLKAGLVVVIEAEVKPGATTSLRIITPLRLHAVIKHFGANEADFQEPGVSLIIGVLLLIYCLLNNRLN